MKAVLCWMTVVLFACVCSLGCEAVPDEDDADRLRQRAAALPIEIRDVMGRWAANRVAYGYCLSKTDQDRLGIISCYEPGKPPNFFGGRSIEVEVREMLQCLNKNMTTTYRGCLDWLLTDVRDTYPDMQCEWTEYGEGFAPERMPAETDAERVTMDTIVEALLGPPPPMEIQVLLLGAGGFFGAGGVLCPMGADWACPENPFDGPGSSSAASGGGDR